MDQVVAPIAAIVVAIVTTLGTIYGARKLGLGPAQSELNTVRKELAEAWEERFQEVSGRMQDVQKELVKERRARIRMATAFRGCKRRLEEVERQLASAMATGELKA